MSRWIAVIVGAQVMVIACALGAALTVGAR